MIAELKERSVALHAELREGKEGGRQLAELARISATIAQWERFHRQPVVPSDPFHRAYRERHVAEVNLGTALVWWQHCPGHRTPLIELMLFGEGLKQDYLRADAAMARFAKKEDPAQGRRRGLEPSLAARLAERKRSGSILDKTSNWNQLSEDEKSKILAR